MDVPITHIIGTAALIGLVISISLAYWIIVDYVEVNVLRAQLEQIAEYVSMNLVNLISLTEFAYGDLSSPTIMIKTLNLPENLNEKPYLIKLIIEGGKCYVKAELAARKDIYAKSPIPLNSTRAHVIIATEENISEISGIFPEETIRISAIIYGGNPSIVVWCWKYDSDTMYAGLGVRAGGA